jgi:murein DD-endopeptidase MepM/ murein hydrolase activator NlpD
MLPKRIRVRSTTMHRRAKLLLAAVVIVALAAAVLGAPASALAGPTRGSGGWFWPIGSENLGSMDGYWVFRSANHSWHMAKDMAAPPGHPVYAIADGVVAESKADAGYGGVLVVWHKTGAGQKFLAVYGHIIRKNLPKGAKVKAGQVIGTVNSAAHCHFGIHPGDKYPSDGNPFRGHTYIESQTYGWVDPVQFLRTHPAFQLGYGAPTLPLVTTVSTGATATVLGVSAGSVYWTQPSDDESPTIFARPILSGETTEVAEDTVLPPLDTTTYLASVEATSFALFNRTPVVTVKFSTRTPAWGVPLKTTGSVKNSAGKAFAGASVCLQRSVDGVVWKTVESATTDSKGGYSLEFAPTRTFMLRVKFNPPNTYMPAKSASASVTPTPGLHRPDVTKQKKPGGPVTISGKLDARHPAGSHTVTITFQQLTAGRWVTTGIILVGNNNSGAGSRYSASGPLPKGAWRVRASCPADGLHTAQTTGWTGFAVK